ncbi:MAG: 2-C-methyl-D-erythritol 4-phosphate cytidylyltransferase [Treponema sp.]|nr:2-C-methyl-D-erythritol 4-phosphate cytidylyltransferase [Treponema sp.]
MNNCAAAVILAAGSSSRMGGIKKEFQLLKNNLTVLGSAVSAFFAAASVKIIVIVVPKDAEAAARSALAPELFSSDKKIIFVIGGETRRASVYNALCALAPFNPCYVLIHDGARPWVSVPLIENIIGAVKKHGAVIPLLPVTDTPKEIDGGAEGFIISHLKRANVGFAQTPQAFKYPEILQAHEKAANKTDEEFTDDAEIWGRFIGQVAVIPGEQDNKKITFPEDLN